MHIQSAITALSCFFLCAVLNAQVPVRQADLSQKTAIAPAYFAPNAFPVPRMNDGTITDHLKVECAYDYFKGFITDGKDITQDAFISVDIPIIPQHVSLSIWMPVVEWWDYDESVRQARRITDTKGKGYDSGDVYVSINLLLIEEKEFSPSFILRSVLKTASGNTYGEARYYDAPGYFFDLTAGKVIYSSEKTSIGISVCTGFLCWQTDNGRQNDALQYGILGYLSTKSFRIESQLAGYSGWEHLGDEPLSIIAQFELFPGRKISTFAEFQHGIKDWPFDQFRTGLIINFK